MGARLPQRFIPALKDYSGMGGASGAAGEGKADQGIANLIKPRCSSRAMWLLLILTVLRKAKIGDSGCVGSVKEFWSCTELEICQHALAFLLHSHGLWFSFSLVVKCLSN